MSIPYSDSEISEVECGEAPSVTRIVTLNEDLQ